MKLKFQLLINVEIVNISGKFRFKPPKLVIYPVGILTFMSRINFSPAELNMKNFKYYNLGTRSMNMHLVYFSISSAYLQSLLFIYTI